MLRLCSARPNGGSGTGTSQTRRTRRAEGDTVQRTRGWITSQYGQESGESLGYTLRTTASGRLRVWCTPYTGITCLYSASNPRNALKLRIGIRHEQLNLTRFASSPARHPSTSQSCQLRGEGQPTFDRILTTFTMDEFRGTICRRMKRPYRSMNRQ